ncbi:MAG TPA: hypothetical protein IAC79_03630 [Candidatus Spyradenecus faecavium]|uniref:Uncharacterized protein n=1 Tax=Candidatus Spyradenecus faecavium TaxID=2840947 RepID=A0A9D1NM16_9BACT|nr:hypothetical protein [Candidatus Spyradenecus faecavium]
MKRLASLLALAALALAGCSPYWYRAPEQFVVEESRLNWVQIYYQESPTAPRVRCDMRNDGQITILEGMSVTVGDDFNIDYRDPAFGDVRKYYYQMDPALFRQTLQLLVDTGLFVVEGEPEEDTPLYPKVMIKANVNHKKIDKFTYDEALQNEIRIQLFQYKMSGRLN